MSRNKSNFEEKVLVAAAHLHQRGFEDFTGYQLSKEIETRDPQHRIVGYGTLYNTLDKLERAGALIGHWSSGNPKRKYYQLPNWRTLYDCLTGVDAEPTAETPGLGMFEDWNWRDKVIIAMVGFLVLVGIVALIVGFFDILRGVFA